MQHVAHIKQCEKHRQGTDSAEGTGGGAVALLSSLPPEGREGTANQSDKQPHRGRRGKAVGRRDTLGQPQKSDHPADAQGQKYLPVFQKSPFGVGQRLHHRAVHIEYHRQHAAGHAGENSPRPDQGAAQHVPQPAGPLFSFHASLTAFLSHYSSSILPAVQCITYEQI